MPVSIRLKRMGRKGRPFYRVVVADTKNPRQGVYVDDIGYYDPVKDPADIQINEEKALMWLKNGSKPTETVRSILSKIGVLKKYHEEKYSSNVPEKQETDQPSN